MLVMIIIGAIKFSKLQLNKMTVLVKNVTSTKFSLLAIKILFAKLHSFDYLVFVRKIVLDILV